MFPAPGAVGGWLVLLGVVVGGGGGGVVVVVVGGGGGGGGVKTGESFGSRSECRV